jgi:hypothetical protein
LSSGFAQASLFRRFLNQQRDFDIRFDADTWLTLPDGTAGPAKEMVPPPISCDPPSRPNP